MTKILLTGGTGFVGTAVTESLLALGHEVHTIGRSTPSFCDKTKYRYHHTFDLTKDDLPKSLMSGTEIFFHIAAKAGVWGSYSQFFSANVTATRKILTEFCKKINMQNVGDVIQYVNKTE